MKLSKQSVLKMDYSNAELRIVDNRLWIIEYDKDGNPMDEWDLMNELENNEGFLEEIGFKISIARTYGK